MTKSISRSHFLKTVAAGSLGAGMIGSPIAISHTFPEFNKPESQDYKIRGFHIDLRSEVMTVDALKELAEELAHDGINAIVMEYEATYPYKDHVTLYNANTYTRKQIHDYLSFCKKLGIEVIPLQECLGHVQYILRHDRYSGLRVNPDIISQIDPLNKDAIPLFKELIDDLASTHPSQYIHVGGDEVRHLNDPKYAVYLKKHGISGLYTQYMKQICQIVIDRGKTPLLWADMILAHPEAVEDLPVDKIVFIDWNYGWDINMFGNITKLQEKGCRFWGSPALRSYPDNYYITRWMNHFDNLKNYIPYTRHAGYEGIVMTSWSTSGQYGYKWDDHNEVMDMFPIRNVYPLSGFRIMIKAYVWAIHEKKALEPENFIKQYARDRFGLSDEDCDKLWRYFSHKQVLVILGKPEDGTDIKKVFNDFKNIGNLLHTIKPKSHVGEFDHFVLMADIRSFYLACKLLEHETALYSQASGNPVDIKQKLDQLNDQSKLIDERFTSLNKGFLKANELTRLNALRNEALNSLGDRWSVLF